MFLRILMINMGNDDVWVVLLDPSEGGAGRKSIPAAHANIAGITVTGKRRAIKNDTTGSIRTAGSHRLTTASDMPQFMTGNR
ncbi:hypothetical protein CK934_26540 [Chitinophaga sp. MD30]|nr:hypothetical protein CK934_26540 [Chitinophaga sp. MD30]